MNHSHLKAFHAVAMQGSFTKAAASLNLTQPTLSDHVRGLEDRYGVKLFKRHGRGVILTAMGRALLEMTRQQYATEVEMEQLLSSSRGMLSGHLRIAADSPFLIMPLVKDYTSQHPSIKVAIDFGNTQWVSQQLIEGHSDIGIMPEPSHDERLISTSFRQDEIIFFVSTVHPWAKRRNVALREIEDQRLIIRETGSYTRSLFEQELRRQNIISQQVLEIGSSEGLREAVALGLGVGIIQAGELTLDQRIQPVNIRNTKLKVIEHLVCLKEAKLVPVIKAFIEKIIP
ncbi:MAG: LysR substrate-binding domain-containing protein [Pseudomonadales bacterium]|nr:LysR substrate-binding domain-containing protein [Pseudomonadales bacterium]